MQAWSEARTSLQMMTSGMDRAVMRWAIVLPLAEHAWKGAKVSSRRDFLVSEQAVYVLRRVIWLGMGKRVFQTVETITVLRRKV